MASPGHPAYSGSASYRNNFDRDVHADTGIFNRLKATTLTVTGSMTVVGNACFPNGSAASPGIAFCTEATGYYIDNTDTLYTTITGTEVLEVNKQANEVQIMSEISRAMTVRTDNSTVSTNLNLYTGTASGGFSGSVVMFSGTAASGTSGTLDLATGDGLVSGVASLQTGDASGGASGVVLLQSGTATTDSGDVEFTTGTGTNSTGWIYGHTGNAGTATSGFVQFQTGTSSNATGDINLFSGIASGAGTSGNMTFHSGATNGGNSGAVQVYTGNSSAATSGTLTLATGSGPDTANVGDIYLLAGNSTTIVGAAPNTIIAGASNGATASHLMTYQSTAGVAVRDGGGAATIAVTAGATDICGHITVTYGAGGVAAILAFKNTWTEAPTVQITPINAAAVAAAPFVSASTTTTFTLTSSNAGAAAEFYYLCIGCRNTF